MSVVIFITEDGEMDRQERDEPLTLAEMQEFVGGLIERAPRMTNTTLDGKPFEVIVNEEGLMKGFGINALASELAGMTLLGPAIACHCELFV